MITMEILHEEFTYATFWCEDCEVSMTLKPASKNTLPFWDTWEDPAYPPCPICNGTMEFDEAGELGDGEVSKSPLV